MRLLPIAISIIALFLSFSAFAQPANDDICNAFAISLGSTVGSTANLGPIDVTGATAQPGEPNTPVGTGPNSCQAQDGWCSSDVVVQNSTWYTFTGTSEGSVLITVFGFDTQLAVYSGSCTDILAGHGTFIAGNDDQVGGGTNSDVVLSCLTSGETY